MAIDIDQLGLPIFASRVAFDWLRNSAASPVFTGNAKRWLADSHVYIANEWRHFPTFALNDSIDTMAEHIKHRAHGGQIQAKLAHLHEYLFEENGYRGASEDFEHLEGMLLPEAITRRSGVPTILCALYKAICDRLGIYCWGVALPGKFICGVQEDQKMLLIDVADRGRVLTLDEARSFGKSFLGAMGEPDDGADWFVPCEHKHWLTRSLANLLEFFVKQGRHLDVAKCLEMEIALWPNQSRLLRDLALAFARCKMPKQAAVVLAGYLNEPDSAADTDRADLLKLKELLET